MFMFLILLFTGCSKKVDKALLTTALASGNQVRMTPNDPRLNTREEIKAFSKSELAPDGFVMPEDLSAFGEIADAVTFLPWHDGYSYRRYAYGGTDPNGINFGVVVSHYGFPGPALSGHLEITQAELSVTSGMENMQRLDSKESGRIIRDDIHYIYTNGSLYSIIIYADGIEFEISFSSGAKGYPMDGADTFLKKLLAIHEKEASAAVKEFRFAIISRDAKNWLIPAGIGLGVVALGVAGFVIRKKKKARSVAVAE